MQGPREIYRKIKNYRLSQKIHPVRRIDRVAPVPGRRVVAITFDDGPCAGPARPGTDPLTLGILEALKEAGAKGTFDIIGSTKFKYPDVKGANGGPYWNGVGYDHYPEFGQDHLGGAVNQPDLVKRIVAGGHQLSNHGFSHAAFGPNKYPYASRRFLPGFDAVVEDLKALDEYVTALTGVKMELGRPPHYIDRIVGGYDAYDAYRALGYLYLGAHFDGGGWQASSGDFATDVDNMVRPLQAALSEDPGCLNGSIIFHKDGYNMSSEAPALEGLKRQLEVLKAHEYEVVTVRELLEMSQFTDLSPEDPLYPATEALLRAGYIVAYADNRVRPLNKITVRELNRMSVPAGVPYANRRSAGTERAGERAAEQTGEHTGDCAERAWSRGLFQIVSQRVGPPGLAGRHFGKSSKVERTDIVAACQEVVSQMAIGEEENLRRNVLIESRSRETGGTDVTRGEAILLLAAALVGV